MTAPEISRELVEWARLAGYSLTPEDHSGAALFWSDPGGARSGSIRRNVDGTPFARPERAAEEQFALAGSSAEVIERHLYGVFGWDIRHSKRLPRIKTPRRTNEIARGYQLNDEDAEGFLQLTDEAGTVVATAPDGLTGVTRLVELSHLISSSSPDEIMRSYESPDGGPLFRV
ncbi:MAG: Imm61 family immunity protein [Mycobacterium sp.]|nr:Imm61 family immunity protein [Mycobacterium sp.]